MPNLSPIVSAFKPNKKQAAVEITIATTWDGIFVDIFLIINIMITVPAPIAADDILIVERFENILIHLSINSGDVSLYVKPKKSFIWDEKITTPMPAVKPVVTGYGINLINEPTRAIPKHINIIPAIIVAIIRPS